MSKITAVIIEDSRLARKELRTLLLRHPEIAIVGEAATADEGLMLIERTRPDLVFLDIQMPGKDGFEVLEMLDEVPAVIFTTAFDEYAIKAFEYNALDYLLKPISPGRLEKAISKVTEEAMVGHSLSDGELSLDSKIFIKDGERCWMVALREIELFESEGNYARVYFNGNRALIYKSLNRIERKVPPSAFFRANRQEIFNLNFIEEIVPWFNGKLKIKLTVGKEIELSRRQSVLFRQLKEL